MSLLSLFACEFQRLEESRGLRADDQALVERLRESTSSSLSKILARADRLTAQRLGEHWQLRLRRRLRWLLVLVFSVLLLLGAAASALALGDGSRPLNVLGLVAALVGPPSIMLLLWLALLIWPLQPVAVGPRLPRFLSRWLLRGAGLSNAEQWWQASRGLLRGSLWPRWILSALSHGLWLAWLSGAMIGLIWAYSLNRYDFVWETTLLSSLGFEQALVALTRWPAMLGFDVPSAAQIAASAVQPDGSAEVARRWAQWSLGALAGYAWLPRLLALGFSLLRAWFLGRRLALDLEHPYYQTLAERLSPSLQAIAPESAVSPQVPRFHLRAAPAGDGQRELICLECDPPADWCASDQLLVERVETREERRLALRRLSGRAAQRLLLGIDPRLSPDRSSLSFIAELSAHAGQLRVVLLQPASEERTAAWTAELQALGLPAEHCFAEPAAAWGWLQEVNDES